MKRVVLWQKCLSHQTGQKLFLFYSYFSLLSSVSIVWLLLVFQNEKLQKRDVFREWPTVSPVGPMGPLGPATPLAPASPLSPWKPGMPFSPSKPWQCKKMNEKMTVTIKKNLFFQTRRAHVSLSLLILIYKTSLRKLWLALTWIQALWFNALVF